MPDTSSYLLLGSLWCRINHAFPRERFSVVVGRLLTANTYQQTSDHLNQTEGSMGEINIPRDEQDAIRTVNSGLLDNLIEQCLLEERPSALRALRLESCGLFVASRLRAYEKALAEYSKAKASKKRAETKLDVLLAGSCLSDAVMQMKYRVETEEKEGLLFYVDDLIRAPNRFSERLTVQVSYRWRPAVEDKWVHGSITFFHNVDLRPNYSMPQPTRKPSAAKQEQDRQEKLRREWEHLVRLGLHSIKEYFRRGIDGTAIPKEFQARTDPSTRGLNNFSTQFWLVQS